MKAQIRAPLILAFGGVLLIFILGLMPGIMAITGIRLDSPSTPSSVKFGLLMIPLWILITAIIYILYQLRSSGS